MSSFDNFVASLAGSIEPRIPSDQTAVDTMTGWNAHFPPSVSATAGIIHLYRDTRVLWAIEQLGSIAGKSVLELGPLEASHTYMMEQAGAMVEGIEANKFGYLKCLIAKNLMPLKNATFHLGDFVEWLEREERAYDMIFACGVLYHMREPLRLLEGIARRSKAVYLWTVCVLDEKQRVSFTTEVAGRTIRFYERGYGDQDDKFCGGPVNYPRWLHHDDLLFLLKTYGFTDIREQPLTPSPELVAGTASIFAMKG